MSFQGTGMLESSFEFCFAQSCLWEFVCEDDMELPGIQYLIVGQMLGSVLGE